MQGSEEANSSTLVYWHSYTMPELFLTMSVEDDIFRMLHF